MPLQQRVIEPVNVSRSTLPLPPGDIKPLIKSIAASTGQGIAANAAAAANINIVNELECVTNGSIANLIRQLSSLSRQAEELLTGVFNDASKLLTRTVSLQQRMVSLNVTVKSLDQATDAPVTLRDSTNQRETFTSDMSCDQQVLSKEQMPSSIAELYQTCDKPPPLNKLDPYRDDGKDGLKFYTDPTYFFELWKKDMMKETMQAQQNQRAQAHRMQASQMQKANQNVRTLQNPRRSSQNQQQQMQQQQLQQQQQYLSGKSRHQVVSINGSYVSSSDSNQDMFSQANNQIPKNGGDLDKTTEMMTRYMQQATISDDPMSIYQQQQQNQHPTSAQLQMNQVIQHAPHQPQQNPYEIYQKQNAQPGQQQTQQPSGLQQFQPITYGSNVQSAPNQQHMLVSPTPPPPPALSPLPPPNSPPPPPPPPAPPALAPPAQPVAQLPPVLQPPTAAQLQLKQQQLRKTIPVQRDPRSDLLADIKQGITLRRVEDSKRRVDAEKQQSMGNDVASILARRVAMQVSDSDDNDDDDDEDNDWEDSTNR